MQKAAKETRNWFHKHELAELSETFEKYRVLEDIVTPIMMRLFPKVWCNMTMFSGASEPLPGPRRPVHCLAQ